MGHFPRQIRNRPDWGTQNKSLQRPGRLVADWQDLPVIMVFRPIMVLKPSQTGQVAATVGAGASKHVLPQRFAQINFFGSATAPGCAGWGQMLLPDSPCFLTIGPPRGERTG